MQNNKQSYDVLELLSTWTIILFYIKSVFIGCWILFKWLTFTIWNSIKKSKKNDQSSSDIYDGYHDKPPSILVDNQIGRHSYVKLKDVKFHYVEAGHPSDPLVLLLHGFPDCWLGWRNQIMELSKYFHVVALDLKGFNDSDKPMWRQVYTPRKICDELRQFIFSLGCHSATIIGHDIGGIVGWFFVHTNPDNVDRFICVSAPHPNLFWDNLNHKSLINNTWLQFVQLPMLPEIDHSKQHSKFLDDCLRAIQPENNSKAVISLRKSKENYFSYSGNTFSYKIADIYKYVFNRRSDWTGPFNYYRNFPFYRIKMGDNIRCPVLVVTGNTDEYCRLDTMVKSTEYCDNFVLKIVEGAGHWPHQEVPEQFNSVILKFLVGRRADPVTIVEVPDKQSKGIMGRMLGAVTSSVKIGSSVLDSVQQRTSDVITGALH